MTSDLKILVTHPWMGRGGSEAASMWTLQALQDRGMVTFVTASPVDFNELNAVCGTAVDPRRVEVRRAPRIPGVRRGNQLVHLQRCLFERHCRRMAERFDLCISTYNPIDFGRPAVQLIGDFSFSERMRHILYPEEKFYHRQSLLRRLYLAAGDVLRRRGRPPLAERGDLAVANSQWTADRLAKHFGVHGATVVYPPVLLPDAGAATREKTAERDPLGFVCLGRIAPEKEIDRVIAILEGVRATGHPVTLTLAGDFDGSDYSRRIMAAAEERRDWIRTPGFLNADQVRRILQTSSFGLHGCRIESFGIAVAEMAAAGCIPFVPEGSGAAEIVTQEELLYGNPDEAVEKIVAMLGEPGRSQDLRVELVSGVRRFSPEAFMRSLLREIDRFAGGPMIDSEIENTDVPEALPAVH